MVAHCIRHTLWLPDFIHTVRKATRSQHVLVIREELQRDIWRTFPDHQVHSYETLEDHRPR